MNKELKEESIKRALNYFRDDHPGYIDEFMVDFIMVEMIQFTRMKSISLKTLFRILAFALSSYAQGKGDPTTDK